MHFTKADMRKATDAIMSLTDFIRVPGSEDFADMPCHKCGATIKSRDDSYFDGVEFSYCVKCIETPDTK